MLWFLRDYPLAALILRAATLSFAALLIGGIVFGAWIVPASSSLRESFSRRALRLLRVAATGLTLTQIVFVVLDSEMLIQSGMQHWNDLTSANYLLAGLLLIFTAIAFLLFSRSKLPRNRRWLLCIVPLLSATVWTSHAASRLEDRNLLIVLTGLHQLTAAIWLGGLPYLWILLSSKRQDRDEEWIWLKQCIVRRYSTAALGSVIVLMLAGFTMAWMYTQSWSGVYGTAYGVVLTTKTILLLGLLLLGGGNYLLVRSGRLHLPPSLLRIAQFSEIEIGIGFTIILAAASLTSQSPAVDVVQNRLTLPEIAARMTPRWPSFRTPSIRAMPPVLPMQQAMRVYASSAEEAPPTNNPTEQAWSDYNHHWAGIIVFAAGVLAILGRADRARWARNWPLVFLALALFLFFRADPEAWPLGPRGFWASFYNPEDLEHRLYVLLILCFVAFEWSVQTHRVPSAKAALVFPAACAIGGALLLTHNHSMGNPQEELPVEMNHIAIAIFAVFAGWSRWLELRGSGRAKRTAAWVWPTCLMLIGMVLLNYRES